MQSNKKYIYEVNTYFNSDNTKIKKTVRYELFFYSFYFFSFFFAGAFLVTLSTSPLSFLLAMFKYVA